MVYRLNTEISISKLHFYNYNQFAEDVFYKVKNSFYLHCKKRSLVFPSPTKLSLAGINLIIPGQGELVSDIPVGDGKIGNLLLQCN